MIKGLAFFVASFLSLQSFALSQVECWDKSCLTHGWTQRSLETAQYTDYMCREDDCLTRGWIAGGNAGVSIYTQCTDGACFKKGWYEIDRSTQQLLATVVCKTGGCLKSGWDIYNNAGRSFVTCKQNDCETSGWVLTKPNGAHVFVTCQKPSCFQAGWVENSY